MESVWQGPLALGGSDAMKSRDELFGELFEAYYPAIVGFFGRRGFSNDYAADLALDTFMRAYQNLHTLRDRDNPRPWLFAVACNVRRNALRGSSAAKRKAHEVPFDEVAEAADDRTGSLGPGPDPAASPLDTMLTRERKELLVRALDELPPRIRQAVMLRIGSDLKYREIAVIQQVSVDTIKAQMHQARNKLRELLGEHFSNIDF
jgi:RNA polymerase sigma-70 factor (ECF subfamily)